MRSRYSAFAVGNAGYLLETASLQLLIDCGSGITRRLAELGDRWQTITHVALTHWSMGGTNGNPEGQHGVWQYCKDVSGEVVEQFMDDYPYTDSPEPNVP